MKKYNILLISIIALLLCLIFYLILHDPTKEIGGTKLNDFLYAYNIKEATETTSGISIQNDKIYYLIEKEEKDNKKKYSLYEKDIYTNKKKKIQEFTKEGTYCSLIENYIQCTDTKKIVLYDFSLKEINQTQIKTEDYPKIVPYKDTFIKIENNKIYIAQKTKEHVIRELPQNLSECFIENYYYTKENTYLLFYNLDEEKYYIYDVNKKTQDTILSKNSYVYKNGFYFYNQEKYQVVDKKDEIKNEYPNLYHYDFYYPSILKDDNETLYIYDISENKINIINIKENTLIKIDSPRQEQITKFHLKNNYLFLECAETNNIYLIDTKNITDKPIKITEDIEKQNEIVNNKVEDIKKTYNINIKIKEQAKITFPDFVAEIENSNDKILETLPKITKILDKYPKEFFDSFHDEINKGINIYLTSTLTPTNTETQISNPAAYSLNYQNEYIIVIDISEPNIEELICHELLHNIELLLTKDTEIIFKDWNKLNPEDFKYNNSYTKPYIYDYTLNEEDINNVYFIDEYSHTYESEDRARVFENICACNEKSIITKYPNLLRKGKYIEEELYKYYPTLRDKNLFESIKNT